MLGPGGLVGQDGIDGMPNGPYSEAWVFPGLDNDGKPLRPVEGTNKCSIVVTDRDHWGTNQHNTMIMPLLRVHIFADTIRDENGNPTGRFADLRCKALARVVDKAFHDPANITHVWNEGMPEELSIIAAVRSSGGGLNITDIPDQDFAVRGVLNYELSLANWG